MIKLQQVNLVFVHFFQIQIHPFPVERKPSHWPKLPKYLNPDFENQILKKIPNSWHNQKKISMATLYRHLWWRQNQIQDFCLF